MTPDLSFDGIDVYTAAIADGPATRREREQAAILAIVRAVFGPQAKLCHRENGAPYIAGADATVSVSHSRRTAVLAVDTSGRSIGIDIEEARGQLLRVAARVFSEAEIAVFGTGTAGLATAWTLKEAAYKCTGTAGLDFRTDIVLTPHARQLSAAGRTLEIAYSGPFGDQYMALVYEK